MNIKEWTQVLNIHPGSVISVVGCGGKTTLVKSFAKELSERYKIGVATTTKMHQPRVGQYRELFVRHIHECMEPLTDNGIYYFTDEIVYEDKLHDLGAYMAAQAKAYTDILLIEADGSKERPLKGWSDTEPVILEDTTVTIGILTLTELGKPATKRNVHRMNFFEKQTGTKEGEIVTEAHLSQMVNHKSAMFKYSKTKKVLFINQIDTDADAVTAMHFLTQNHLEVDEIYYGSLRDGHIERFK